MTRKMLLMVLLLVLPGVAQGAEKFGMVFDLKGTVELHGQDGKTIKLTRGKHILHPVYDGDRIKVSKDGMILVVSVREGKGYNLGSNSSAAIKGGKFESLKGKVTITEGLKTPARSKDEAETVGAMVLRGGTDCLKQVFPANTAILELQPTLNWDNQCSDGKHVLIRLLNEKGDTLFNGETTANELAVPEGKLVFGGRYKWIVYDTKSYTTSWSEFSIPDEAKTKQIKEAISQYERRNNDLPQRLSFVFFLIENNLKAESERELAKLGQEFPENNYIESLGKE